MRGNMQGTEMNTAAIVCDHVAVEGQPILNAERSEPLEDADSGWQFLCGGSDHVTNAKVWALHEVVAMEPSLTSLIDLPAGTSLSRGSPTESWIVRRSNAAD